MSDVILKQKRILNASTFNEARTLFDEYISQQITREETLQLLEFLQHKVENPIDVTIVAEFYKKLNAWEELRNFLNSCPFQDDNTIKILKISIEKKLKNYRKALDICDTLPENDFYQLTQKASILNKTGNALEARETIEPVLIANMSEYSIKAYISIILSLTKDDNYAVQLCIPNLASHICKEKELTKFSVKRFFKLLIKYEDDLGNKRNVDITRKIYQQYLNYAGGNN